MKNIGSRCFPVSVCILTFLLLSFQNHSAQLEVYNAIQYKQISSFEEDYSINAMKMSADGSKIIFSTGGPQVKVFTINTDGSGLNQIYDFQTTGTGPFIDINANGEKVIWCHYGRLFIANSDGSAREEIAGLLPHPNPDFADFAPDISLPPRITVDGSQVYFVVRHRDPLAAGIWRVNADGSNISHLVDYMEVAQQVFGTDGSEFDQYSGFADGFDISAYGSRMVFGTHSVKLLEGDIVHGHAIVYDGNEFKNLGEYAVGAQPFCTDFDGDKFIVSRREFNTDLQADEINIYFVPYGTGDQIKVIGGLDIYATSALTQMSANGSTGIVMGGNGRLPITLIDRVTASRLDLVSFDGVSRAVGGFNFSASYFASINANADMISLLSYTYPSQIWIGKLASSGVDLEPSITLITLDPNYVVRQLATSTTEIKAYVTSPPDTIIAVTAETFMDGEYQFRGLDADGYAFFPRLYDNGTLGDEYEGDNYFTNNTVKCILAETPLGEYRIRIAAANSTLREITAVDVAPFSILGTDPTSVDNTNAIPKQFDLKQNYPNPFNPSTTIEYSIPILNKNGYTFVRLVVYDILGNEVSVLVDEQQTPGIYKVEFDASILSTGVYYYQMKTGDIIKTKKMLLIK